MEPLDAARCMSNVVRMIVEHGQDKVRRVLERMLADGRLDSLALGSILRVADERPESHVPQSLQHSEVESACAADFDHLLQGGL
jgi:hypothetical protein